MLTRRLQATLCAAFLSLALTADIGLGQTPSIGYVDPVDGCEQELDIRSMSAELFSLKSNGEGIHDDWMMHMDAKGGACVRTHEHDVGLSRQEGVVCLPPDGYQMLGGNFARPESPADVVFAFLTFPDGQVVINSGDLSIGFNMMYGSTVQTVGQSHPLMNDGAGIELPGDRGGYTADLGAGPESFPRPVPGGWELAFAPLVEVHHRDETFDTYACGIAGNVGDLNSAREEQPWGALAGYNIYRRPADAGAPTAAEMGRVENFVYFAPVRPDVSVPDELSELVDPDGIPQTGDEVVLFRDLARNPNGRARAVGLRPESGRNYWYAFQPVAMGALADWSALEIHQSWPGDPGYEHGSQIDDWRTDLDSDGFLDSITVPRFEPSDDGSGPTFISPQAKYRLVGLGLTNGGEALLSPMVHTAGDQGDEDCSNGSDDDGDALTDCEDGDCSTHPDCDGGGGIRVGLPGGPEVIVTWDETMGHEGLTLSRGILAELWNNGELSHVRIGCELVGSQVGVEPIDGSSYFLLAPASASSPDFGADSFGNRRLAGGAPCP